MLGPYMSLMWNFFRILCAKNNSKHLIFDWVIHKTKGGRFYWDTVYMGLPEIGRSDSGHCVGYSSDLSVTEVCVSALAINNTRTYEGRRWKILPKFITEIISWKHVVHLLYPCGCHRFYGSRLLHRSSTRSNKMDIKVAHGEASSIHNWSLDKSLLTSIVHGILEKERRIKRSESRARSLLGSREKPAENRSLGQSPQKLWVLHTYIHTYIGLDTYKFI